MLCLLLLLLLLHPFNSLFSRTTWVSWYHKGKTSLDLNKARDYGVWGWQCISWTICKQSAPRSSTSSLNFYRLDALPNAQPTPTVSKHWRIVRLNVVTTVLKKSAMLQQFRQKSWHMQHHDTVYITCKVTPSHSNDHAKNIQIDKDSMISTHCWAPAATHCFLSRSWCSATWAWTYGANEGQDLRRNDTNSDMASSRIIEPKLCQATLNTFQHFLSTQNSIK